jgi:hypothetical protein
MYYGYHKNHVPEALAAQYPNHPVYGTLAIFGESLEALTGIPLLPEEINSYVNTKADPSYMSQLIAFDHEADREIAHMDAIECLRVELQSLTPDSREIQVTDQQGKLLHDDWLASQPTMEI